jgi:hypothetical protein
VAHQSQGATYQNNTAQLIIGKSGEIESSENSAVAQDIFGGQA